jgi:bis(5'-nucleosidyl)-tetraphosphatase
LKPLKNALLDQSFGIVPIGLSPDQIRQFLLIQHRKKGHWGFPKGHAESNETATESACREFEEETGITDYRLLDLPPFLESYSFIKQPRRRGLQVTIAKTVTYFVALVNSMQVTLQADEIQDAIWLPYPAALERITFTQGKQLLTQVHQVLGSLDFEA